MSKRPFLKSPYPYFGGKARVAHIVWNRFGNVANYVEPFFGSGAVLLGRPHPPKLETVNDIDGMIVNFWRSVSHDPDDVVKHADWPPSELDLIARNKYLVENRKKFTKKIAGDPEFYDAKIAGWWVWGQSCWIGAGWAFSKNAKVKLPHMQGGEGIHRTSLVDHADNEELNFKTTKYMRLYMTRLHKRLRRVRFCCGSWDRLMGPSVTFYNGLTGLFFDPPYSDEADRTTGTYAHDDLSIAHNVRQWCIENGDNKLLRIALCGYEGEHAMPDNWTVVKWKAQGGYGSQGGEDGRGRKNSGRERIWFSPHCIKTVRRASFFGD